MTKFVKFLKARSEGDFKYSSTGGSVAVNPDRVTYVRPLGGGYCALEFGNGESLPVGGELDWVIDRLEKTE